MKDMDNGIRGEAICLLLPAHPPLLKDFLQVEANTFHNETTKFLIRGGQ